MPKLAILDSLGKVVVKYDYDAWGNHTITASNETIANLNPFRYRGYFYDTDTGLYYLKTRYYDPEVGRFLNMDAVDYADPETLGGLNLYAYCNNNPVMYVDPNGNFGILATIVICIVAGAAISSTISVGKQLIDNGGNFSQINWREVGSSALKGAALGLAFGLGGAVGSSIAGTASLSFTVGEVLTIILISNYVAGVGAYAINYAGTEDFDVGEMFANGLTQAGKSIVNFILGGMFSASGLWGIGNSVGSTSMLMRSLGKAIISWIPFRLFDI